MKILVACEESQAVTIELRRLGHEAYSCDIEPCSGGHLEWHIQADVLPILNGRCDFDTADGLRWTGKRRPEVDLCPAQMKLRWEIGDEAALKEREDVRCKY